MKNSRVSVISFSNQRVVKNERDKASFEILYPDDLFKQIFQVFKVLLSFMS